MSVSVDVCVGGMEGDAGCVGGDVCVAGGYVVMLLRLDSVDV